MAKKKRQDEVPLFAQTKAITYAIFGFSLGCGLISFLVWRTYTWVQLIVASV